MIRPFKFLVLLLTMTGFWVCAKAQGSQIVFDSFIAPDDIVSPDTAACFSDPLNFNVQLRNVGTDPYTGLITIKMRTPLGVFDVGSVTVTAMGPADSAGLFITDSITSARFGGGVNIIVIWPEIGFLPPVDSVTDTIVVLCGSSTDDPLSKGLIIAYPNPSFDGKFFLSAKGLLTHHTPLEVCDATGRIVWRRESWTDEVNLSNLPSGLYLLRANPPNALPVTVKLLR